MADDEKIILTQAERLSPAWQKVQAYAEARLKEARGKLEGDQSEIETAKWRGRIQVLKGLLALAEDEPPIDG